MFYRDQELDEKLVARLRKDHREAQAWLVKHYAQAHYAEVAKYKAVIDEIEPLLKRWDAARRKK